MKFNIQFPLVLALLVFLTSCEKIGKDKIKTTTVTGQVRTFGTEDPVRGAPVSVMLWHLKDRINDGFVMIDSVRTDEQGWYTITHDLDENEDYFLSAAGYSGKLYVEMRWLSRSFTRRAQVPVGGSHTIHLEPVAYGYVHFHFINLDPHPSDRFAYNLGSGAYEELYGVTSIFRLWNFGAGLQHSIAIGKTEMGIDTTWKQYFTPIPFDTIPMLIEF